MHNEHNAKTTSHALRHDWTKEEVLAFYTDPFNDVLAEAHTMHRQYFDPNIIQISSLLSIKTGSCPEDCAYCPQSAHYNVGLQKSPLMEIEEVVTAAQKAKNAGATRFCMGAAWRSPKERDLLKVIEMIKAVKAMGLETCVTLGMLEEKQAYQLKEAGLDFYNHNIDTSENFYKEIITTRVFQDRLDTLDNVEKAGIHVCCGSIIGMGESQEDRAMMLMTLANRPIHPKSIPINLLITIPGTPLEHATPPDPFDFVRTIAAARSMMPESYVRLSAGRENMSEEWQALCYFAGANSIFYGETLLTAKNPVPEKDQRLFAKLGLQKSQT